MKRRAKIDIPDCLISKGEIYEFFEAEGFGTGKDCRRYEIREWKGAKYGKKLMVDVEFIQEAFEEVIEPVSELGLLTALKVIIKSEPKNCATCKLYTKKSKTCSLGYCFYMIAKMAKKHIEAGDK